MGKSAPAAPDYTGAANAQAQSSKENTNMQTWANRPTTNTPWGSQTWDTKAVTDPATGQAVTEWTQNINLTPEQQSALDSQQRIQQGRSNAAETLLGQATGEFQRPMDWGGLPQAGGAVQAGQMGDLSNINSQVRNLNAPGQSGAFQFGVNQGQVQGQVGQTQSNLQQGVGETDLGLRGDFGQTQAGIQSGLGNTQGQIQGQVANTPDQVRQRAQDAVWALQKPGLDQQRSDTENQLANMGLARGSEAWNRESQRMDDSFARAQLQAVEAGRQEAGQMFGQQLQQGQFANQAQAQEYQQMLASGQFGNQAQQQEYAQLMGQGEFGNRAQQQEYQQMLQSGQFGNQAQQQEYAQMLQSGQFGNQAQAQEFGQNYQQAGLNNQALQQQYAQDLSGQTFENQGQQQQFQNMMALAQRGDQQALQQLQMQMNAGGYNTNLRQQAIAEMLQRRGQPLNELNALLTGQQVSMPQQQSFNTAGKSETADLMGAATNQYSASMDAFNAKQAQTGQILQGMGSAAMMFSDIRLKEDIKTVGKLASGLRLVEFGYKGVPGRWRGVIAQEALKLCPEAVSLDSSGFYKVDYSKVQ